MRKRNRILLALVLGWMLPAVIQPAWQAMASQPATVIRTAQTGAAQTGAAAPEQAEEEAETGQSAQPEQVQEPFRPYWKVKKGKYYYKTAEKKWAQGITQIGEKKYYFDRKHIQRVGWQKIGKAWYYFRIANGKKGYMVCGKSVNHIKLGKDGKAKLKKGDKKRLWVLCEAQKLVQTATRKNPSMDREQKLKVSWKYVLKHWRYVESPDYRYQKGWEVKNADFCFFSERGDCMAQGAAFAFVANACGYPKACAVSSGGHGWAEVGGKVCDPTWAKVDKKHSYFLMKMSLSGRGGRPRYKSSRKHVYRI